jgi:lipopolysaccharide transport system ATP-binding protein
MGDVVIEVSNLSKRYVIRHLAGRQDALRHRLEAAVRAPWRRLMQSLRRAPGAGAVSAAGTRTGTREEFWALQEVSFEIQQGEVVGIIGRNGAGKSTLLKILSRITEPTRGRICLRGRVASLLEVGTGFHQELTGRENIFLNGAILGMSRAEIQRKFDEIVAFSEVEKFLDTPVKRYSSGMYVRLAFAVAAHLEPEILIVDEVLAVGDAQFQKKCLGKMEQVARGGRTVLFVSHNMAAVQALCTRAIYLREGRLKEIGPVTPVTQRYLAEGAPAQARSFRDEPLPLGRHLRLLDLSFQSNPVSSGDSMGFRIQLHATARVQLTELSLLIYSALGVRVGLLDLREVGLPVVIESGQTWTVTGRIKAVPLVEGDYQVGLTVNTGDFWEDILEVASFTVNARPRRADFAPYPVVYRATVEFDWEAKVGESAGQPSHQ